MVVLAQVVHLVLMLDFFYYYLRAMRKGGVFELPLVSTNV